MKILIMGFAKLKYMPYLNFYLDHIDCKKHEVQVLYWNRDCCDELIPNKPISFHEFKRFQDDDVPKANKIRNFIKYRNYAIRILKQDYDFIIVLHSIPGVLTHKFLIKHYAGRFIYDYRDYTYEGIRFYKKLIHSLVNNSYKTFVSSDAFRINLPKTSKISTSHNILLDSLNHRDEKLKNGVPSDKIRIAFWGFIRHEPVNRKIIEQVSKDSRFELHYYGKEQDVAKRLKQYSVDIGAGNVTFHGEYKPEDRYELVRSADLIHNIYHDTNMMLAMGNKYYDGAIFYIPQLCMKGSFMGEQAMKAGIGIKCDPYDNGFLDEVWVYYKSISKDEFNKKCDDEVERVKRQYYEGIKVIKDAVD